MAVQRMTYKKAGVDIAAADRLVRSIRSIAGRTTGRGLMSGIGGFGALYDLNSHRFRHPVLVSSTDGVGTKLRIAFMMGVHHTVGIDLVAMSVNDILTQGAVPLFFLDYFSTGKLRPKVAEQVIRGIAEGCRRAGCALIGGETAEMPSFYAEGEYDLAGFAMGAVERDRIFKPSSCAAGDLLVGLPSSGLHSNGYSLARKVLLESKRMKLGAQLPELGQSLGKVLLEPTVIYAKTVVTLLKRHRIKGIAHITGGGIPGNLVRILPPGRRAWIHRSNWKVPPIFSLIQKAGRLSQKEMDLTFNNGLGMILIVGKREIKGVERSLRSMGQPYDLVGELAKGARGVSFVP